MDQNELWRCEVTSVAGIHGRPGPGTDRSESVQDFDGPGSVQSQALKIFSVLVRTVPRFPKFFQYGPVRTRAEPLSPGRTDFGLWIPDPLYRTRVV